MIRQYKLHKLNISNYNSDFFDKVDSIFSNMIIKNNIIYDDNKIIMYFNDKNILLIDTFLFHELKDNNLFVDIHFLRFIIKKYFNKFVKDVDWVYINHDNYEFIYKYY